VRLIFTDTICSECWWIQSSFSLMDKGSDGRSPAKSCSATFGRSPILRQTSSLEQLLSTRPIPDMLH
ncbi:MAG: hypothetical protein IJ242_02675, partial [Clostridia bacterium]|nr:hypothetical protein [Clostridia bacterium]